MLSQRTARHLGISGTSIRRILRNELGLPVYKVPLLTNEHKEKEYGVLIGYERTSEKKTQ